jgi:hypothetical protein
VFIEEKGHAKDENKRLLENLCDKQHRILREEAKKLSALIPIASIELDQKGRKKESEGKSDRGGTVERRNGNLVVNTHSLKLSNSLKTYRTGSPSSWKPTKKRFLSEIASKNLLMTWRERSRGLSSTTRLSSSRC